MILRFSLIALFQERLTAREAMAHAYFAPVVDAAKVEPLSDMHVAMSSTPQTANA